MSLVDFPMSMIGLPIADQNGGATLTTSSVDLNASTDQIEILFTVIADGTCTGVDWLQGTASVGVGLTIRLETINMTTGRASGTLYHANATATASASAGWVSTAWSSFTVNRGDKVALVIKPISGTPTAQRIACFNDGGSTIGPEWPRVIEADGTPADVACGPIVALNYNGTRYYTPGLYGMSAVTPYTYNTGSANDTYGAKFRFPVGVRLTGVRVWVDSDGDFEVALLDSSKTLLTSVQWDKDLPGGFITASSLLTLPFDDSVELTANTDYYVLVRATTATSITLETQDVTTANHRTIAHPLGTGICVVYCDYGAGPWSGVSFTEVTTEIPFIDFFIDGIDQPSGGGISQGLHSIDSQIAA